VDIIDAASGAAVGHLQAAGRSSSRADSKTEVAAVAFIPAAAGRWVGGWAAQKNDVVQRPFMYMAPEE
jgi:hypothetical protein